MKIYNGEGMILGRLATQVAKAALLGEDVKVVNCEKIVLSGQKEKTFKDEKERRARKGYPLKSAKHSRLPERYVRRAIRGMLPWKQSRGREAFARIMCYRGVPAEYEGQELITVEGAAASKLPTLRMTTVGALLTRLGGKAE
jgi:large subunit ribosomal protein L13